MRWAISNEGSGSAFLHIMEQYGLGFRHNKIEIYPLEPEHSAASAGGPIIDGRCQTTTPGLFAAGDEAGGIPQSVGPGALTMGYLAAESAMSTACPSCPQAFKIDNRIPPSDPTSKTLGRS